MSLKTLSKTAQAEKAENEARAELKAWQQTKSPEAKLKLRVRISEIEKIRAEIELLESEEKQTRTEQTRFDNLYQRLHLKSKDLLEEAKKTDREALVARGKLGPLAGRLNTLVQQIEELKKRLEKLEIQDGDEK